MTEQQLPTAADGQPPDVAPNGAAAVHEEETLEVVSTLVDESETTRALLQRLKKGEKRVLEAIRRTRDKFEDELKGIRERHARADELCDRVEGLVQQIEEAASSSESHVASAQAASNEAGEYRNAAKQVADLATSLRAKLDHLVEESDAVDERAKRAAERCVHINDGFEYVQETRPKVEQAAATIRKLSGELQELANEAREQRGRLEKLEEASGASATAAAGDAASVSGLVEKLEHADERVTKYEADIGAVQASLEQLEQQVRDLLPEATSAGLSAAFYSRAKHFKRPAKMWESCFVVAMLGLFGVGIWWVAGLNLAQASSIEALLVSILERTLLVVPLVWLAVHAGARAAAAKRIEEDYEYKAALARCFEGYKAQLEEVEHDGVKPLIRLCEDVLGTLALQPGRLYDTKYEQTPADVLANATQKAIGRKKLKFRAPMIDAEVEESSGAGEAGP